MIIERYERTTEHGIDAITVNTIDNEVSIDFFTDGVETASAETYDSASSTPPASPKARPPQTAPDHDAGPDLDAIRAGENAATDLTEAELAARDAVPADAWPRLWAAYNSAYQEFRDNNPGWQAFYTDHHGYALDAALRVHAQLIDLPAREAALLAEVERLKGENVDLESAGKFAQRLIDVQANEKSALKSQVRNLTEELTAHKAVIRDQDNDNAALTADRDAARARVAELEFSLGEARSYIEALKDERARLRAELTEARAVIAELRNECGDMFGKARCRIQRGHGGPHDDLVQNQWAEAIYVPVPAGDEEGQVILRDGTTMPMSEVTKYLPSETDLGR